MRVEQTVSDSLSQAQRRLFENLSRRKLAESVGEEIEKLPPGTMVPLSPSQARIWFFGQMYPGSTEYNSFCAIRFKELPDNTTIDASVRTLMERHDVLCLRILEQDQKPLQVHCRDLPPPITFHDLSHLSLSEAERRLEEIGSANARTPFTLERPPLFRLSVIRLPGGGGAVVLVLHHVIVDGWSMGILCDEMAAQFSGRALPPPPGVCFLDYVSWQQRRMGDHLPTDQLAYWQTKLGGELPVLDVPKDRPRGTVQSRKGEIIPCLIPAAVLQQIKQLASAQRTTLFVILLAAYKAFLFRVTGQTDIIVGVPFAGREHRAVENMVGCFVNTAALRTEVRGDSSFRSFVDRVHSTTIEAQDNQSIPFERIVQHLKVPRDPEFNPIFQTLFVLQNTPAGMLSDPNAEISEIPFESEAAKFDLTLSLTETPQGASGFIEYSTDLFDKETVVRYVQVFTRLVAEMAAAPDRPLKSHILIPTEEKECILYGLNKYERPWHTYRTMAEPFEEQVERTPHAVALIDEAETMSYVELNERANRLGHFLRSVGLGRGDFVALCMERSFSLIVALYGVAKCGAAYVPIDPDLPEARIAFMLEDTTPAIVLTHSSLKTRIPPGPWRIVSVDEDSHCWTEMPATNLTCDGPSHHLVHLLYTSGSTGRPKAVSYPIDGAITEILWLQRFYPFQAGEANIFKTSYGFDVSIWEIFWPLYFGARLVVCRPGGHRDPRYLIRMIEQHGVTMMFLIPAMLQAFLDELPPGGCPSVHWIICGGEAVTPRLRDAFYAKHGGKLVQGYGPTEAGCVTDMIVPSDPGSPIVPLGRPAANYRLYVLDDELEVLPVGIPGEAYIACEVGLAHGYHSRPDLTAEKFLPDPFGPLSSRMYRTGDVCRYRPNGVLEHLGRSGRQIKIRGMRIEPAEIETVLCESEMVANSVVLPVAGDQGSHLVAFVVPQGLFNVQQLAEYAQGILPRYMVPTSFIAVDGIPTTLNGKIDRAALLGLLHEARPARARMTVPPSGIAEEKLKLIFERVLGCQGIGVTDSFFALGGHSLLVFKLIHDCGQVFPNRPSVADVFTSPSVRELALIVDSPERARVASLTPIAPALGKPIVIFVHAASGSALPFFDVATRLKDKFSTFAMQSPEDEINPPFSIQDLAQRYVEEIDVIRGLSPMVLVGWSMGGCVAIEMARQWRERQVEVAALLMLDTWIPPDLLPHPDDRSKARVAIKELHVFEDKIVASEGGGTDHLDSLRHTVNRNREAFLAYRPAWVDCHADYLRATGSFPNRDDKFPESYLRTGRHWEPYVRNLTRHDIDGDHFTLIAGENTETLAATIRRVIADRLSFSTI